LIVNIIILINAWKFIFWATTDIFFIVIKRMHFPVLSNHSCCECRLYQSVFCVMVTDCRLQRSLYKDWILFWLRWGILNPVVRLTNHRSALVMWGIVWIRFWTQSFSLSKWMMNLNKDNLVIHRKQWFYFLHSNERTNRFCYLEYIWRNFAIFNNLNVIWHIWFKVYGA